MTRTLRIEVVGLLFAIFTSATECVMASERAFEAEGVYVRHLRIRVPPAEDPEFETLMKRLAKAAAEADLPEEYDWLCYREPPDKYWLLFFSESPTGFAVPSTLSRIADQIGRAGGGAAHAEIMAIVAGLDFVLEWEILGQQKASWSTVREMSTSNHPKARIVERSVRSHARGSFDAALSNWTSFLVQVQYPLPVEGFVLHSGSTNAAWQVVFPVDWTSFHGEGSVSAFVAGLDPTARARFAELEGALMRTVSSAEHYDGDFLQVLSYSAE